MSPKQILRRPPIRRPRTLKFGARGALVGGKNIFRLRYPWRGRFPTRSGMHSAHACLGEAWCLFVDSTNIEIWGAGCASGWEEYFPSTVPVAGSFPHPKWHAFYTRVSGRSPVLVRGSWQRRHVAARDPLAGGKNAFCLWYLGRGRLSTKGGMSSATACWGRA